jgi:heme-degrading monooxygenase HmoA
MHGRASVIQGPPERADEIVGILREQVLPQARQIAGFRGVLSLLDRGSGKSLTVTLWESEEAMRASEETANRMRDEASQASGGGIVSVERYEVVMDERA